jgi:copper chaperone CopZ
VGKAALDGLKGVKKVENGFREGREINTVYYDPTEITIEEMVKALKDAGTYRGTAE